MMQTVIRREYLVRCDGCGHVGPTAASLDAASQLVQREGWEPIMPLRGYSFLVTWLCPSCQQHREAWTEATHGYSTAG